MSLINCLSTNSRNNGFYCKLTNLLSYLHIIIFNSVLSMSELIISLLNHRYPFGQTPICTSSARVEQIQIFSDSKDLREKKSEMLKKNDAITNAYIIKLLAVYQENLHLHYVYEYVPYTLTSYILMKYKTENKEIWEMTKKLFIKKITYELTILISYLAKMKIQLDLKSANLGITENEKIKVYMSSKCRMGHKTELNLINTYGQCKDKILKQLNKYVQSLQRENSNPPHFKIDGNKLVFDEKGTSIDYLDNEKSSKIQESGNDSILEKIKKSGISHNFVQRKFSFEDFKFGLGSASEPKLRYQHRSRPHKSRQHKYSYQCNNGQNPSKSYIPHVNYNNEQEGSPPDTAFSSSKKIKIELQQKQNINSSGQKERKNSYKVKITSFREYEVNNCDAEKLFKPEGLKDEEIFQYFSKKDEKEKQEEEEEGVNQNTNRKERKTTSQTQNTLPPPNSPLLSRQQQQSIPSSSDHQEQSTSAKDLEQKVKAAKERAVKVLTRMKTFKKSL